MIGVAYQLLLLRYYLYFLGVFLLPLTSVQPYYH